MKKLKGLKRVEIFHHDLPADLTKEFAEREKYLAIDTETGGLDYRKSSLYLVQIANSAGQVAMVRFPNSESSNLISLLQNKEITSIYHNAAFDLAFLKMGLMAEVGKSIDCTKTLMKIVFPQYSSGLGSALNHILDISLSKSIDHTRWDQEELSTRQIEYASGDVLYLYRLLKVLKTACSPSQYNNYTRTIRAIRSKVFTEVEGYTDLFQFEKEHHEKSQEHRLWWNRRLALKHEEDEDVTM